MFEHLIRYSIRHRWLILSLSLAIAVLGLYNFTRLPIDAVPDITNVQVQINTEAPGYTPLEVEQRVTTLLETAISGLPQLDYTRSISRYGLSQITVVFDDGTDIHFARQLLSQRLQEARERIPDELTPSLGPISTGLGEIFMYTVENTSEGKHSPTELRAIQDWIIKPQLRMLEGVAEVNSIGGYERQYHVTPDPKRLLAYNLTLGEVVAAIQEANSSIGSGYIERHGEQYLVRSPGRFSGIKDIENAVVATYHNTPVYLKDIAEIAEGKELRTGAATKDGEEAVLGTVFMLMGENSRTVSLRVGEQLEEINRTLPQGAVAVPVYDRTSLVNATIATVRKNLFEGAVLVIAVLFLFLGSIRAALITATIIPLSMLLTVSGMVATGITGNLMSLGAIDFGLIVDGAVIIVENCMRRLAEAQKQSGRLLTRQERFHIVFDASREVRQATMFGELIIMIVYLPILALAGVEGKLFHPMAYTVILALLGALVFSVTFVPAAVALLITGEVKERNIAVMHRAEEWYRGALVRALRAKGVVLGTAVTIVLSSLLLASKLGSEFVPSLDEGDVTLHALRIPGTGIDQAVRMQHDLEHRLKSLPEVLTTFSKVGTAEIANDPMPPSVADVYVMLKPRREWREPRMPKEDLVAQLAEIAAQVPGNNYEFTQPIEMRFNELIAGVRSDVAVKIFGDDLNSLEKLGAQVVAALKEVPGAADVKMEPGTGLPFLNIVPNREQLARYGLRLAEVQSVIATALGGTRAGEVFHGDTRVPIVVRLPEHLRTNIEAIRRIPIPVAAPQESDTTSSSLSRLESRNDPRAGHHFIPLQEVASIRLTQGPNQIGRENGKRRVVVTANVRDATLGGFVQEANEHLREKVKLPAGYWVTWGGQFEQLISAQQRLNLVIPATLLLIFGLLYTTFGTFRESLLVFTGVPLALTGGVVALWLRGIPFSISAAIGFIALSGVAVLNGLVMITFIRRLVVQGGDVSRAIIDGSVRRLRPVLMTALVASLGFIPMALSTGTGSEVQRPLATVVIGGILSSTLLTLFVLPVLYSFFGTKSLAKDEEDF